MKNPVMFVLEVVTLLTTVILVRDIVNGGQSIAFELQIVVWLWFTVLFANFAEAVAEGRGKAQADTLRKTRTETRAKRVVMPDNTEVYEGVSAEDLEAGDIVVCEPGDIIPGDGEVIEGIASVNEAAITGESAPVIRESGGDRSAVTGGTTVHFRPHRRADHVLARHLVPRPHDQAGRRRRTAEDAERDRAQHPAGRPDHHLRVRDGDHPELRRLCRRRDLGRRAGGAVRDADPDHHRRAALGHRHRRHGPAGALQRAGDVRPRRGGGRRRRYAAARQDRHRDLRQPSGDRDHSGARRHRARGGGGSAAGERRRRDRGRPLHRHAGAGEIRRAASARAGGRQVHRILRHDPAVGRRHLRQAEAPQGRDRLGAPVRARAGRTQPGRAGGVPRRRRQDRALRRHAAGAGRRRPPARRDPSQGRGEARREGALRRVAPHGHQDGDDHRRQSGDRRRRSRRKPASTTSSPRRRRRTSCATSATSRRRAG